MSAPLILCIEDEPSLRDDIAAELGELAASFNAMLARLEDAFARLSAFSADIAHELRTPLSNLLTQTQVILSQPRALEDYQEALHSNLEELQHLAQMVGDMLLLAKADNGLLQTRRETLALERELTAQEASCLFVSHDRAFVRAVANRFWLIEKRKLIEVDGPEAFFEETALLA